jgi:hypothetical protein
LMGLDNLFSSSSTIELYKGFVESDMEYPNFFISIRYPHGDSCV